MSLLVVLPTLFFFISLLLISRRKKRIMNKLLPPGPPRLPIIGNLHQFGQLPHRSLFTLSQTHGPIMTLKLFTTPVIVASSSETAQQFLKTHDAVCCSRPDLTPLRKFSFGSCDIAFAPYGEQWRELRKICMIHFFSTKKVASFRGVREDEVERLVTTVSSSSKRGSEINLSKELLALSNDIICRTAIGRRYGSDGGRLHELLLESQGTMADVHFADLMPVLGWVDMLTGKRGRLDKCVGELSKFYEEVIEEHKDPLRKDMDGKGEDALDALLAMQKEAPHVITDNHIMGVLMDIFVAGSDTSATAVEWAMTELMRNPLAMVKAQNEVRGIIGNKGKVEECDLEQLHYLNSVIKETMRLHPPVPLIPRETIGDCNVDGYDIPAGTRFLINTWAIGRDSKIWDGPHNFVPERFLDRSIDFKGHDFQLIPFGAGRRICPGMHSATFVFELALANLLYQFNWELPKKVSKEYIDMSEASGITVHRKLPLCLMARIYQHEDFKM